MSESNSPLSNCNLHDKTKQQSSTLNNQTVGDDSVSPLVACLRGNATKPEKIKNQCDRNDQKGLQRRRENSTVGALTHAIAQPAAALNSVQLQFLNRQLANPYFVQQTMTSNVVSAVPPMLYPPVVGHRTASFPGLLLELLERKERQSRLEALLSRQRMTSVALLGLQQHAQIPLLSNQTPERLEQIARTRMLGLTRQGEPGLIENPVCAKRNDASKQKRPSHEGVNYKADPPELSAGAINKPEGVNSIVKAGPPELSAGATNQQKERTGGSVRGGILEPFPEKLHRLLREVEESGRSDIISFVAGGRAFKIHKPDKFFNQIVPDYFHHSRLSSFKRQLHLYGFRLVPSSIGDILAGAYCHELFLKDNPNLCTKMRRSGTR